MQLGLRMHICIWFFLLKPAPWYNLSPSTNTPLTESNLDFVFLCTFSMTAQSKFRRTKSEEFFVSEFIGIFPPNIVYESVKFL